MAAGLIHYATYFDRHYLTRGLALHRSLARHSPPFTLWVLCLDDQTYRALAKLRPAGVEPIPLAELERADPALPAVKPARTPVEYYWTCGPAFLNYLFAREPRLGLLTYLDADLYFFGAPGPIYDELGDGSILLIHHRWRPPVRPSAIRKGLYNVGLLAFRRTAEGLACLGRWRQQCLEWCHDRIEPSRFGDQKYLDEWPGRYRGARVLQHPGAGLAPWNVDRYRIRHEGGRVWVDGEPLIFYHFNRLRPITSWLYEPCFWYLRESLSPVVRAHVYAPYVREVRAVADRLRANGARAPAFSTLRSDEHRLAQLARMAWRRNFLVVTDTLVLWG